MVAQTAARQELAPITAASRDDVLARYQRIRQICREHHGKAVKFVPGDAMLRQAGRLGLRGQGKTFLLNDMNDMSFVLDLLFHTAPNGRSRGIDRYAAAAALPPASEEAQALRAMLNSRFALLRIERRHEVAGVIALDIVREKEFWLLDLGMEASAPIGSGLATRLMTPAEFSMTLGVLVPLSGALAEQVLDEVPPLRRKPFAQAVDDRRFAETLYRIAFASGIMERIRLRD